MPFNLFLRLILPCPMRFLMHALKHGAPHGCIVQRALDPLALCAWILLQGASANAQLAPAPETAPVLVLESSPLLQEQIPASARNKLPTFIVGERLSGRTNLEPVVQGNAMLRRGDLVI